MIFFDTNIWIYALTKNVDNTHQQQKAIEVIEEGIKSNSIITSDLLICEFAFISDKIGENHRQINNNLDFLSQFKTEFQLNDRLLEIIKQTNSYKSSFDISHLVFCEFYNSKLFTFDKGFKKLKEISKIEIIIL